MKLGGLFVLGGTSEDIRFLTWVKVGSVVLCD